jgi:hypothetical protein
MTMPTTRVMLTRCRRKNTNHFIFCCMVLRRLLSFQLPAGQKPDKANLRKQWCQALGIGRKDIVAGEKELRIAYWHFPECFRHFDEKVGAWKLKPTAKWVDNEKKEWLGAVPIRNLDVFVSSYLSARHEPTFRLPAVVSTVQKPRQITFSPSSSGRILYALNSTHPLALSPTLGALRPIHLVSVILISCRFPVSLLSI